jgi:nicotinate dehydrogenase subunit A
MVAFTLNGAPAALEVPEDATLLHALRGPGGLSGPRFGCGTENCGSCMVLLDGAPAYACTLAASACAGRRVTTVEGLGTPEAPHPLQQAFLAEQAGECAYCVNGMLMVAAALLSQNAAPSVADIKQALNGNLCRCGSQARFVRAVQRAAGATA